MIRALWTGLLLIGGASVAWGVADPEVFSGPQAGEPLGKLTLQGAIGDWDGKEFDPVADAGEKPLLLIFVHAVDRPSVGMTRVLGDYAAKRTGDGLRCGVVFLTDDPSETAAWMKRAQGALPKAVSIGISKDGQEGPGEYGLNRKVSMTILVAKAGKVTANFALVQPSIKADAPRVLQAIVDVAGGKAPSLEELGAGGPAAQRPKADRPPPKRRDEK